MSSPLPAQRPFLPTAVRALPDRRLVAFLPLHIALTTLVMTVALVAIGLRLYDSPDGHAPIAMATGLAGIGLIAYARYFLGLRWLSASVVYLMLFWMFHFGMTFTATLIPSVLTRLEDYEIEWLYWPNVRFAMILGVIGAAGFVFGVGFFAGRSSTAIARPSKRAHDPGLYIGGWLIMLIGIATSVVVVARYVGLEIFSVGYMSFLAMAQSTTLGTALGLSHLGCLLAVCGAGGRLWLKPLAAWGVCIALPTLLLGSRSGAMISLVGFAVVLTHRGVRFRRGLLAAAVLTFFVGIPAIQAFRIVGFANRSAVNWTDVTPLDTFMELGGSLRATKAFVDWIEEGDSYLLGLTYWAPFDRQVLVRVLPFREPIPYEQDERVPQRMMGRREGSFGGSATGEAYYNFGPFGPFMFCACVGALFGWLEKRWVMTPAGCVALGIVMFVFYFHIRGDWLTIPATIAEGLALLACCFISGRLIESRAGRSADGPPQGLAVQG
jgi:hypothetical protein